MLKLRQPAVSQQLARLRADDLVETRRDGKNIYYSLARPEVRQVIEALHAAFCAPRNALTRTIDRHVRRSSAQSRFATLLGFGLGAALRLRRRGAAASARSARSRIAVYGNDTRRLRTWLLAIGVAIVGVHAARIFRPISISRVRSIPARGSNGAALIIGGLMFGFGMALNGTCGMGTLRQIGGGDLRALVTFLVMGVTAMMTMRGLTGVARVALTDPLAIDLGALGLATAAGLARAERAATAPSFSHRDRDWLSRSRRSRMRLPRDPALCRHRRADRPDRRRAAGGRPALRASTPSTRAASSPSPLSRRLARRCSTSCCPPRCSRIFRSAP